MPVVRDTPAAALVVAVALALAGCGGDEQQVHAPAPARGDAGAPVSAEPTAGLLGPAQRADASGDRITSRGGRISPRDRRPGHRGSGVAGADSCPDATLAPEPGNVGRLGPAILCLLNAERAAAGLPPLSTDDRLARASQGMSDRIVAEHFFSHVTPDGKTLVDRVQPTGYIPRSGAWVLGENLGWGSGSLAAPAAMVNGWMNSKGHRDNILAADYREVGVGIALGSPAVGRAGGATYTTDFGLRPGAAASGSGATSRSTTAGATAALRLAVPSKVGRRLRRTVRRGFSYRARCSRACTLVARLYLDGRTARSAHLASKRIAVARGRARLRSGGRGRVKVRLSARAKRALRRMRRVRLVLRTSASGTHVTRTTRVTLR